jgi:hypothetical protein
MTLRDNIESGRTEVAGESVRLGVLDAVIAAKCSVQNR